MFDYQALSLNPLTLVLAAGAGLLSFRSPCVLTLVPAYLGYMTGMSAEDIASRRDPSTRARILGRSLAFIVGLSAVFSVLGASASFLGQLLLRNQTVLLQIAGLLVIALGLHTLGLIRIPLLYREKRPSFGQGRSGYVGSFLMGASFAAGWTPCVGPFLAGLLALASQEETVSQGVVLLFTYGLGLGLPFVVAGLALGASAPLLRVIKTRMHALEIVSGVMLVGMGLLIFSDRLSVISAWMIRVFGPGLAT